MSARMSRTSSRSSSNRPTTISSAPSGASSISTKSTRSAASRKIRRSPAMCRARACSRRLLKIMEGTDRLGTPAGRPQTSPAGIPAGRHHRHFIRLRRSFFRPGKDHLGPRPGNVDRLRGQGGGTGRSQDRRDFPRGRAGGPVEIRPDPGIRWAPASARHPRRPRRAGAKAHSARTEECAGETVPAVV